MSTNLSKVPLSIPVLKDLPESTCVSRFPFTHEVLTNQWDCKKDYNLTVINGSCDTCWGDEKDVITQVGVARLGQGVNLGVCFECLPTGMKMKGVAEAYIKFTPFSDDDYHIVSVTSDGLKTLLDQAKSTSSASAAIFESKDKGMQSLTLEQQELVQEILKSPELAKKEAWMKRPYQCKGCEGYLLDKEDMESSTDDIRDSYFYAFNNSRQSGIPSAVCFCCKSLLFMDGDACSMTSCSQCMLTASKICVFCLDGAVTRNADGSLVTHDLGKCSRSRLDLRGKKEEGKEKEQDRALPAVRLCDCNVVHIK